MENEIVPREVLQNCVKVLSASHCRRSGYRNHRVDLRDTGTWRIVQASTMIARSVQDPSAPFDLKVRRLL
ncbi:MAG: hypothetical protein AB7S36_07705 [Planctomycetota bacterium]